MNAKARPHRAVTVGITALLVVTILLAFPFDVIEHLVGGWIYFLQRVGPEIKWDPTTIMTGCACTVGFVVGLHYFAKWLLPKWSFRLTTAISALVLVTFTAGICAVGVVHQTTWLFRTPSGSFIYHGASNRVRSQYIIRGIGTAIGAYADVNGELPPGYTMGRYGEPLHSWMTHILPQLEHSNIYTMFDLQQPWNAEINRKAAQCRIYSFESPHFDAMADSAGYHLANYAGNIRVLQPGRQLKLQDITDGTSNTILVGEISDGLRPWAHPLNLRDPAQGLAQSKTTFGGPRPDGNTIVVLVDGSTRTFTGKVSPSVLRAFATPNGNEPLEAYDD